MIALIIICALGILAMISEIFNFKKLLFPIVIVGIVGAFFFNLMEWNEPVNILYFDNMIQFDKPAIAFSNVILFTALLWFVLSHHYFKEGKHLVDHYALVLFSLTGALMLTAFTNMATLFLGIEILSIPLYVLAASKKSDMKSNEAGFKYLIMGSFASSFLLFGIALIYGATASFDLTTIQTFIELNSESLPSFFYVGLIFIMISMLFKVSVAPFHFWAPDVYEGSPILITALMSTVVKTAAFAAFMSLFLLTFRALSEFWVPILSVVIALSLLVSNLTAGTQTSVKRMLAYSSISHASFMLMVILANNGFNMSVNAIVYYSIAYSLASLSAFGILYYVKKNSSDGFDAFNGLYIRNPVLAIFMTLALLSLTGIPITAGFFAKYFVFITLIDTSYVWLSIIAILASAVGACYYLKVIIAIYYGDSEKKPRIVVDKMHMFVFGLCAFLILFIGAFPGIIAELFAF